MSKTPQEVVDELAFELHEWYQRKGNPDQIRPKDGWAMVKEALNENGGSLTTCLGDVIKYNKKGYITVNGIMSEEYILW